MNKYHGLWFGLFLALMLAACNLPSANPGTATYATTTGIPTEEEVVFAL